MANREMTKKAIAQGLKSLLKKKSLEKVSVKDITQECGLSRNAFYYHFKDKYEVVDWIFYTDVNKSISAFQAPSQIVDGLVNVCSCLYEERDFYRECFKYTGQNSLMDILSGVYYKLWRNNLESRSEKSQLGLSEVEIDLIAKMNTYSLVGMISDWLKDGISENYITYFDRIRTLLNMEYYGRTKVRNRTVMEHVRLGAQG